VYYHWVYTLLVDPAQRYPLPSVLSLGIYSAGDLAQRMALGEGNQQSICPVIGHWAEDGEVNQQSIYPVIVHWAEDTFWARSTSRVYTQ
jgi:hypothetical protein